MYYILVLSLLFCSSWAQLCSVDLTAATGNSWVIGDMYNVLFDITASNPTTCGVNGITFSLSFTVSSAQITSSWNMEKVDTTGNTYRVTNYEVLSPGRSFQLGVIVTVPASSASELHAIMGSLVATCDADCPGGSTIPPTSPPTVYPTNPPNPPTTTTTTIRPTGRGYCAITVTHSQKNTWTSNGQDYTQYECVLRNLGPSNVLSPITFKVSGQIMQIWNVISTVDGYTLPFYVSSILTDSSFTFGYTIKGKIPAVISSASSASCESIIISTTTPIPTPYKVLPTPSTNEEIKNLKEQLKKYKKKMSDAIKMLKDKDIKRSKIIKFIEE